MQNRRPDILVDIVIELYNPIGVLHHFEVASS